MANITKTHGNFKFIFNYELASYEHFCTARQFYNFKCTFYKKNPSFNDYNEMSKESVEDWMKEWAIYEIAKALHTKINDAGKKYFMAQVHFGSDSGWSYSNDSWINALMFEALAKDKLLLDDSNNTLFYEVVMTPDSLREAYQVQPTLPTVAEEPQPVRPAASGITEAVLQQYLSEN